VVAINKYGPRGDLTSCVRDAEAVRGMLRSRRTTEELVANFRAFVPSDWSPGVTRPVKLRRFKRFGTAWATSPEAIGEMLGPQRARIVVVQERAALAALLVVMLVAALAATLHFPGAKSVSSLRAGPFDPLGADGSARRALTRTIA
jgi:hypothetical protein